MQSKRIWTRCLLRIPSWIHVPVWRHDSGPTYVMLKSGSQVFQDGISLAVGGDGLLQAAFSLPVFADWRKASHRGGGRRRQLSGAATLFLVAKSGRECPEQGW